jgi:2-polyprenyl-3-methyl-5-hydroxy-6-metoxy-1,4-benzoquinol methylase
MNQVDASIYYSCPQCGVQLLDIDSDLSCNKCGSKWRKVNGIPYFVEDAPYWGESGLPQDVMRNILKQMESRDWHEVLLNYPDAAVRNRYKFIADTSRARWHEKLDLGPEHKVLDLGAGLGTATEALAGRGAQVYSAEQVEERVQFMRIRFQQKGFSNVHLLRAGADSLPFRGAIFDLIVLNGVLEWMPFSRPQDNPRDAQLHYLKKAYDLLKPGGTLYLGIENRTNYSLLLGSSDPHILLRWVAVLPRPLANAVTMKKTGQPYRTYIYSYRGYCKMLSETGFKNVKGYAALPSYANPQRMVDLGANGNELSDEVWPTVNPVSKAFKSLALRFDKLKYFGPAYVMFAQK